MNIEAKVKLKFKDDDFSEGLILSVTFKLPGQIFSRKLTCNLADTWYIDDKKFMEYNTYEEFLAYATMIANDRELIEEKVKDMIKKYVKDKEYSLVNDIKKYELKKMAKNKGFTFNVKIEESETQ